MTISILFVGSLSQRKGVADLFAVAENLKKHVELTVVGKKAADNCKALDIELAKHTWIPSLPHDEILKLMREHDVLVVPLKHQPFACSRYR